MSKAGRWSTTAANNNAAPPDGWPEGQAPSTVNDCARENMAAIKTALQDMDFFDHDFTPTFINVNSFSVPGDQTTRLVANRRLKLFDGATIYRAIATASFTTVTTISLDAGTAITSSLSSFAISIINPTNPATPANGGFDRISASAIEATTLSVSGATVLKSTLSVEGATVLGTTLSVSGAAVLKSTLSVGGAVNLATTLTVGGATHIAAAFSVGGATTLGTTLSVSGAAVLKSTLSVGGAAIIAGTITNPQVFKAWVAFSGQGVVTIRQSFNVTSITDVGVGNYTVNITDALSGSGYAVIAMTEASATDALIITHDVPSGAKTPTSYNVISVANSNNAVSDAAMVHVGFLGT